MRLRKPPSPVQVPLSAVHINVSVRVGLNDFEGWEADQIAAFLEGIAQLTAAEFAVPKGAG